MANIIINPFTNQNLPCVQASINFLTKGEGNYPSIPSAILIDTGAGGSFVPKSMIDNLDHKNELVYGINKKINFTAANEENLNVPHKFYYATLSFDDGTEVSNVEFFCWERSFPLLGWDVLEKMDIEVMGCRKEFNWKLC